MTRLNGAETVDGASAGGGAGLAGGAVSASGTELMDGAALSGPFGSEKGASRVAKASALSRGQRELQRRVEKILEGAFGELLQCQPRFWGKRAYWVLAGAIYERIVLDRKRIPMEEMIGLAKMLMEHRRMELIEKGQPTKAKGSKSKMSEDDVLAEAVRKVYGVETTKSPKPKT